MANYFRLEEIKAIGYLPTPKGVALQVIQLTRKDDVTNQEIAHAIKPDPALYSRLQLRTAYEGTGIGLALCRKIAEHHKGRIWAGSAGEGRGSKFCVVLPVLQEKTLK
ncbi:MAG: ATP-binding protein [Gallionella sp.]|nr:ATP-binding protein [Gallionella sp.]